MNRAHLHFTLRQVRDSFRRPVTLTAVAGVAIVLGISGPFDTIRAFDLPARLAYWGAVVPLTYAAGMAGSVFVGPTLTRHPLTHRLPTLQVAGRAFGSALLVCLVLVGFNSLLGLQFDLRSLILGFGAIYMICLVIETMGAVIASEARPTRTHAPALFAPPILTRLPVDKRGQLVALRVQDHYVQVVTTKGSALILMRLSDAMAECAPIAGVQIHRSTWVALDQVAQARRSGDAAVVVTSTGLELSVARTRLAMVQAAGVLPRKG